MVTTPLIETIKVAMLAFDAQAERTRKILDTNNIHTAVAEKIDESGYYSSVQTGIGLMDQKTRTREMEMVG